MTTTPMTPGQWLEKLRAEGVTVTGYLTWETHERDDETGKTFGPVNGVTIHHTAGRDSKSVCYNGTSSLPGPLCHSYLPKTGTVHMMSAGRANHAGTFAQNAHNAVLNESSVHPYPDAAEPVDGNDHYYGIEIENLGDGEDEYTWAQYVAAVKWATAICRHHGWTENSVIGHKEGTRRKIDPKGPVNSPHEATFAWTMDRFRRDVKAALALPAGEWQSKEESVALTTADVAKIAKTDGVFKSPDYALATEENKFWTLESYQYETYRTARTGAQGVARLEAAVKALSAKVDALQTGGVDLDALADKVADKLADRLAE